MKERFSKRASSIILTLALIPTSCSPVEAAKTTNTDGNRTEFPSGLWRYTSGPHNYSGRKDEPRFAIDIAPEKVIACPAPANSPRIGFSTIRAGTVYSIGSEDPNDKNYGIVRVKDRDGIIWSYGHLEPNHYLKVGEKIPLDYPIGTFSCRYPRVPGGGITGFNVDVSRSVEKRDGTLEYIPMKGTKISGFTVNDGEDNYNGTLTKPGEPTITADQRICIPTKQAPVPCGKDSRGNIITNAISRPIVKFTHP